MNDANRKEKWRNSHTPNIVAEDNFDDTDGNDNDDAEEDDEEEDGYDDETK